LPARRGPCRSPGTRSSSARADPVCAIAPRAA
jgi:hypothetical protein